MKRRALLLLVLLLTGCGQMGPLYFPHQAAAHDNSVGYNTTLNSGNIA